MHRTNVTGLALRAGPLLLVLLAWTLAVGAQAHPEDELCLPGQTSLDPMLCEQLAAMDRAGDVTKRPVQPLVDADGQPRGAMETLGLYMRIGVGHILPGGLDHILFVVALVLTSTQLRPLIIQITTFTLAHTATLGLAAAGVISPAGHIVEPLIAASIAFVALENLWVRDMPRWRPAVVFGFGLLHGMGFAGFFGELGLPAGQFWSALIGFNIGVEVGQLSVVLAMVVCLLVVQRALRGPHAEAHYRRGIVIPASMLIGVIGMWWAIERTFFA